MCPLFPRLTAALGIALACGWTLACTSSVITPDPHTVRLDVIQTGGFTGATERFRVDGSTGMVYRADCRPGCPEDDGEPLVRMSAPELADLVDLVVRTELRAGSRDYGGDPCCDKPAYVLTWREAGLETEVTGVFDVLPVAVLDVVNRVLSYGRSLQPVIVALGEDPAPWPRDGLEALDPVIQSDRLEITLRHGGGCADHAYGLLAWNGWLESDPVQVDALLAHEDFDDPCDAVLETRHSFDLIPLRIAFGKSYGPGPATLQINLQAPGGGDAVSLLYSF